MAHKTLIDGTSYNIVGGSTLVDGTSYRISAGKTLIGGTGYSIPIVSSGFDWPGLDNATWEDIYNLCVAKQQGLISDWPSDVVVGAEKSVTLTSAVLGTTTHLVRIIGLDQDYDNSITFECKNCLATGTKFSTNSGTSSQYGRWSDPECAARQQCQNYYNAFPGKQYIRPIEKGTGISVNSSHNAQAGYTFDSVFILSEGECGLTSGEGELSALSKTNWTASNAECTKGKTFTYQFYTDGGTHAKQKGDDGAAVDYYWLRSRLYVDQSSVYNWVIQGTSTVSTSYPGHAEADYISPAFVIAPKGEYTIADWPGWSGATFGDLNNLCVAVQEGKIDWPSDITVGSTKSDGEITYTLIGIGIDGPGILTFLTRYTATCKWASSTSSNYAGQTLDTTITNTGNSYILRDYVVPLDKEVYNSSGVKGTVNRKFWSPSVAEITSNSTASATYGPEYTVGVSVPYPGLTRAVYVPSGYKWTRTRSSSNSSLRWTLNGNGSWYTQNATSSYQYNVAFAIGNPDSITY